MNPSPRHSPSSDPASQPDAAHGFEAAMQSMGLTQEDLLALVDDALPQPQAAQLLLRCGQTLEGQSLLTLVNQMREQRDLLQAVYIDSLQALDLTKPDGHGAASSSGDALLHRDGLPELTPGFLAASLASTLAAAHNINISQDVNISPDVNISRAGPRSGEPSPAFALSRSVPPAPGVSASPARFVATGHAHSSGSAPGRTRAPAHSSSLQSGLSAPRWAPVVSLCALVAVAVTLSMMLPRNTTNNLSSNNLSSSNKTFSSSGPLFIRDRAGAPLFIESPSQRIAGRSESAPAPLTTMMAGVDESPHLAMSTVSSMSQTLSGINDTSNVTFTLHDSDSTDVTRQAHHRPIVDGEEAVRLARAGRLLVRVVSSEEARPFEALQVLGAADGKWRVEDEVTRAMLEAIRPYLVSSSGVVPNVRVGPNQGRFLTSEMFGPPSLNVSGKEQLAYLDESSRRDTSTFIVQLHADAASIDHLRDALRSRFRAGVLLEEIATVLPASPSLPDTVDLPVIIEYQ
jgi:hypothetical protein